MISDKLYLSNCYNFLQVDSPDVKLWSEVYHFIGKNTSLVDRSGVVKMPFNLIPYPDFEVPKDHKGFSKTYEQCCDERVKELVAKSDQLGVPIYLLYSGGIDSTTVLVSFMKALTPDELKSRLVVLLNQDSINENPNFYYNYVRKLCRISSSDRLTSLFDGKKIIVGGEHNDQLFGSDLVGKLIRTDSSFDFKWPYNRENISKCFKIFGATSDVAIDHWITLVDQTAKEHHVELDTVFHFFWWLNFVFKWQSVFCRMLLRVDSSLRTNINTDFVQQYYHHFFSSKDFQRWSMANTDLKIKNTWYTYKFTAKDLIYEFNKDADYRDNKLKVGSLYRLFLQKDTPVALTDNFEYIYNIDVGKYYQPNNSFILR